MYLCLFSVQINSERSRNVQGGSVDVDTSDTISELTWVRTQTERGHNCLTILHWSRVPLEVALNGEHNKKGPMAAFSK